MFLWLGEDRGRVGRDDLPFIVDAVERVTRAFDLVKEANCLWRVALEVPFHHNDGVRKAIQGVCCILSQIKAASQE
ncbi:MAG: hypothetical protein KF873_12495 [Gemmataceae bacterium]|nr:hypothetical protein [Gemmataceae bacterium]